MKKNKGNRKRLRLFKENVSFKLVISACCLAKMARRSRSEKKRKSKVKRGRVGKKILQYSEEQMLKAIEDVKGGKAVAAAARENNVPRVSLHYKSKGLRPVSRKMGPNSEFIEDEEKLLVDWIISSSRSGFPVTKHQLLESAGRLLTELGRELKHVKNGSPGRSWYRGFLRRNPTISSRVSQNLTLSRSAVSFADIKAWFSSIHSYLTENQHASILEDPSRVFNADETAFFLNPKGLSVLACKTDKTVYQQVNPDEKECITVLITASADGRLAPPHVVFKYERIPEEIVNSVPSHWGAGKSDSGWMNRALFYEFVANVFLPWIIEQNVTRPVILFIDGHSSHLSFHTSSFCDQNGIILAALYPNSTHILQPMDVSVFRSLKEKWRNAVHLWRRENMAKPILKKKDFSPLLSTVLDTINPSIIQSGFRKCGLFPWNPNAVHATLSKGKDINPDIQISQPSAISPSTVKLALNVMEMFLDADKLRAFGESNFESKDESLFHLWGEMKKATDSRETASENGLRTVPDNIRPSFDYEVPDTDANISLPLNQPSSLEQAATANPDTQQFPPSTSTHHQSCQPIHPLPSTSFLPEAASSPQQSPANLPSPFKRALIWPENSIGERKKRTREVLPSVVTSQSWRDYYQNKTKKKEEMETQKKVRALERERKRVEKEELKNQKRLEREKKKNTQPKRKARAKKSITYAEPSSESEEWVPSDGEPEERGLVEGDGESVCSDVDPGERNSEIPDVYETTAFAGVILSGADNHPPANISLDIPVLPRDCELQPAAFIEQVGYEAVLRSEDDIIQQMWVLDGLDIRAEEYTSEANVSRLLDQNEGKRETGITEGLEFNEDGKEQETESKSDEERMDGPKEAGDEEGKLDEVETTAARENGGEKQKNGAGIAEKKRRGSENVQRAGTSRDENEKEHDDSIGRGEVTESQYEEGSYVLVQLNRKRKLPSVCKIISKLPDECATVVVMNQVSRVGNVYCPNYQDVHKISKGQILKDLLKPLHFGSQGNKRVQFPISPFQ